MKILLDTHLLLWASSNPDRLSTEAFTLLSSLDNELFFSAASLWEIAIKQGLGRDDFQVNMQLLRQGLLDNHYKELPITSEHTIAIESLPLIHKDPFDRLLVAQATTEGMLLLTSDSTVAKYPGPIRKV